MAKHRFSDAERFSIWKHHGQQCYWCDEPLRLQETTVDHVIPESLQNKDVDFSRVKLQFGLHEAFELNSYENWLPAHDRCNRSKGSKVFAAVPMLLAILDKLRREAPALREAEQRLRDDRKADELLGKILVLVETDAISKEDIIAALADPDLATSEDISILAQEFRLHIDSKRWQVIHRNGHIATVSDGRVGGITPTSDKPHQSWQCPTCGSYGPWNGVRCLTCGQMSDPGD